MDADEALARMLQEEELREAQAAGVIGPGHGYGAAGAPDPAELEFEAIIQSTMATAMLVGGRLGRTAFCPIMLRA